MGSVGLKSKIGAILVVLLGAFSVWAIIFYLPAVTGLNSNPTKQMDSLETDGWIQFEGITFSGEHFSLEDSKGKIVILSFWASWCSPCLEEFPSLLKLAEKFPNDFELVAVSSDENKSDLEYFLKSFPEYKRTNVKIVWDSKGEIAPLYNVQKLPENFIFSKEKKLVKKVVGTIDWSSEDSVSYFELLAKQ